MTVDGEFGVGDPVLCTDPNGKPLARGLSAYSSGDIERIRGIAAKEFGQVLGYSNGSEVIHRDDLVILDD